VSDHFYIIRPYPPLHHFDLEDREDGPKNNDISAKGNMALQPRRRQSEFLAIITTLPTTNKPSAVQRTFRGFSL
jgi:hypothetical protein